MVRKKELVAEPVEVIDLGSLISSIYDVQHMRILFENRGKAINDTRFKKYAEDLESVESVMKRDAMQTTKTFPIHKWIIEQKGLSYDLAGQLIGLIEPISRFKTVTDLYAYSGMGVMDVCQKCGKRYYAIEYRANRGIHIAKRLMEQYEKKRVKDGDTSFNKKAMEMLCQCPHPEIKTVAQRRLKGTLSDYNDELKSLCYKLGDQFIKQGEIYRELYDKAKETYMVRDDLIKEMESKKGKKTKFGETKGTAHINNMARRFAVKIFLEHLWRVWRESEGLEAPMPYPISILGHADYIPPKPRTLKECEPRSA
jgi:hypothetical protein